MLTITTRKFVEQGEKKREITGIKGCIPREELPTVYLRDVPRFAEKWSKAGYNVYFPTSSGGYTGDNVQIGQIYEEERFQFLLLQIKRAGDRLHAIRVEEKKLKGTWKGTETFVI